MRLCRGAFSVVVFGACVLGSHAAEAAPVFAWTCTANCAAAPVAMLLDFTFGAFEVPLDGSAFDEGAVRDARVLVEIAGGGGAANAARSAAGWDTITSAFYDAGRDSLVLAHALDSTILFQLAGANIWASGPDLTTWFMASQEAPSNTVAIGHLAYCPEESCFNYYENTATATAAVPEPSTLLLFGVAIAASWRRRAG